MSGKGKPVTPAEAKAVWDATPKPSLRKVAARMTDAGRKVSFKTLQRWQKAGWSDGKEPQQDLAVAAEKINDAAPALTGDARPVVEAVTEGTTNATLTEKTCRELMQAARHLVAVMRETAPAQMLAPEAITKSFDNIASGVTKVMDAMTRLSALREGELKTVDGHEVLPPVAENPKLRALLAYKPEKQDDADGGKPAAAKH